MDDKNGADPLKPPNYNYGRRRSSLLLNVRMPSKPDRPHLVESNGDIPYEDEPPEYQPSNIVQGILNTVKDRRHQAHPVFCELDVLKYYGEKMEWREAARWVKFEEVVEEGGKRWSKPHVASLSMHAMKEARKGFLEGAILLDADVYSWPEAIDRLLDEWISSGCLDSKLRSYIRDIALLKHKHRHVKRTKSEKEGMKGNRSLSDVRNASGTDLINRVSSANSMDESLGSSPSAADLQALTADYKPNSQFMKKLAKDAEGAILMVGEVDELEEPIVALIRLRESRHVEGLSEVLIPCRFIFFLLGPTGLAAEYREIGRCVATMLIDDIFREVAYKAQSKDNLVAALDEFVEQVTVLPPGEWDPKIRIEPPQKVQSQEHRKESAYHRKRHHKEEDDGGHAPDLTLYKIPCKGLILDIRRKLPFYGSDYKDALHIQCLAAFVYVFLGTLTPNVTFGGLLGVATDQYMGVMECIFAAAVTGILFALFSGQPLNILGSTGPMLVLETIIYNLCKDNGWDFMPARVWVGLWTAAILLLIVVFNLSALVKYITRFTEESFATLIAVIFIVESFKKVVGIQDEAPVNYEPEKVIPTDCMCVAPDCNSTLTTTTTTMDPLLNATVNNTCEFLSSLNYTPTWDDWGHGAGQNACIAHMGTLVGEGCNQPHYVADVFFFSILLFLGTFGVAVALKDFKLTTIFPSFARSLISDFAVLIAIVVFVVVDILLNLPTPKLIVPDEFKARSLISDFAVLLSIIVFVAVDMLIGLDTPKLLVPSEFKPTRDDRGWLISPISDKNPWWIALAASVPALLCTILVFLDQQITAVIVNRKENKLKKGVGYHLDLFVLAICIAIHSILGLPWYVAATVSALAHINSLKKESETAAPGEKPEFLGCREQRVTALFIGILSGAAVFITNVLKVIPMPVLYGVFLYMGYSAMRGMQLVDRLFLFVQPIKYQPDLPYLRHIPLWKVHVWTIVQILCLGVLWAVKSIKAISIGFPLMVLATGLVRRLLEFGYTQEDLKWLDDPLPGREKVAEKEAALKKLREKSGGILNDAYQPYKSKLNGSIEGSGRELEPSDKKKPLFFVEEESDLIYRNSMNSNTKL